MMERVADSLRPLKPESRFTMTLLQLTSVLIFVGAIGYGIGTVHAQLAAHKATAGHPVVVKKVEKIELTLARVVTVLERLERRDP
jgi:hypothetical protein